MMDTVTRFDMDGFDVEEFICADGEYVYYVDYAKLKQERDEAIAQVEVMRSKMQQSYYCECGKCKDCNRAMSEALSITTPAALREIQARTLEDAAGWFDGQFTDSCPASRIDTALLKMAAAKRKGE